MRFSFLLSLLLGSCTMMTTTTTKPKPLRSIEGITEYNLDNGLKVLLLPDQSQSTVTVNITYLVGSRHEGRGETGMAHLLEHMLFKGTPKYPDAKGILQSKGAFLNATTWFDRTNYFETLPASEENLKFALDFESDRMINAWIRQEDLDSEMTVVRNEFEIGENDPIHVLHDQILSAAFRWHNYGKSTIGNRSDIERVPVSALKPFYKNYYQPDNAVLIIAGKFEADIALDLVNKTFGEIKKPTRTLDSTYTEEPTQDGARFVKLMRAGEVAAAGVSYHIPSGVHPDFAAVRVLVDVLSQEPGGYLYEELIKTHKASEVFGMSYQLAEPGMVMFFAKPVKDEQVYTLKDDLINNLENNHAKSITAERVDRAQAKMLKHYKILMSNSKDMALRLSESIAQGDYRLYFWHRDELQKVSIEDVKRVAQKYLVESNRTAGVFEPTSKAVRAEVTQAPEVKKILESYNSDKNLTQGEKFEATPDNLDKRTQRLTLENNIKAALLTKQTRGDIVKANFIFRYGTEESLNTHVDEILLLQQLLIRGTQDKSFQKVQDELDKLQSTMRIGGAPGQLHVDITSDKKHINQVILLMAEVLKTPALSEIEFDIVKKKEISEFEEALVDPKTLGFNQLERLQNPWPESSIHYVPTIKERLEKIKLINIESLKTLYRDFFGADHLEFAAVGSFDSESLKNVINKNFSAWKSKKEFKRITKPYKPVEAVQKVIITPDKQMALLALGTNLELIDTAKDYPAIRIGSYVLGESMKSRIWNRLRETEGLSYGAGSWLEASKHEKNATMGMYAMASTHNADKALSALKDEYKKWLSKGITKEELEDSKSSFRSTVQNLLSSDGYVVANLASGLELGRTFQFQADLIKNIEKLSVEDVQAALNKYVKPMSLAEVKAGDFK